MPRPSTTVRVDQDSYEILQAYRLWLQQQKRRRRKRVTMAEAVRELLVRKARDLV
jgi:hypothetical protein